MTDELEPLKECPFQKDGELHIPVILDKSGEAWVRCSCDVTSPIFSGANRKEKATEFWNHRYKRTVRLSQKTLRDDEESKRCNYHDCPDCGHLICPTFDKHCAGCGTEVVDD